MRKLSVFLLLTILVNISWAEIPSDSLTSISPSEELNVDAVVTENVNEIEVENTTVIDDGELVTTETAVVHETTTGEPATTEAAIEQETTTENETINSNTGESTTTEAAIQQNTTTEEPVTTGAATEQETTTQNETINSSTGESVTTEAAMEQETTTQNETINSSTGESVTTEAAIEQETTTENETTKSNTEENSSEDTTTNSPAETQPTTASPAPVCSTVGLKQPHEKDCRQYYECSAEGSQNTTFHFITKSCPEKNAFSSTLNRCSRDISSCPSNVTCVIEGNIADPASNTSHYYCKNHYNGTGFYLFHIDCEPYQLVKCKDVVIVKEELKIIKNEYKLKEKEMKEQKKAQEKLQKQKEKEAKKNAKKEEKLKKEEAKKEAAIFVCVKEGNFASKASDNLYIVCIKKKDKFKAVSMQCVAGTTFNSETGTCGGNNDTADDKSLSSDDEGED